MAHYVVDTLAAERNIPLATLAKHAMLNYVTVKKIWENTTTRADLKTLAAIAAVLGVGVSDLIADSPHREDHDAHDV